ncbi:hypothetical protein FCV25MIE_30255 [Fagus crenata]
MPWFSLSWPDSNHLSSPAQAYTQTHNSQVFSATKQTHTACTATTVGNVGEPDRSEVLRSGLCRARHRFNKEDDSDLQRTRSERSFQARQLSFSANLAPKTIGLKDITLKALSSSILSSMSSVKRL